jgi:hypothetical protein
VDLGAEEEDLKNRKKKEEDRAASRSKAAAAKGAAVAAAATGAAGTAAASTTAVDATTARTFKPHLSLLALLLLLYDNVNQARNTSIFNNSILNSKINATGTHDWLISLYRSIFEFNIELLNIDVFLASFTLSYHCGDQLIPQVSPSARINVNTV